MGYKLTEEPAITIPVCTTRVTRDEVATQVLAGLVSTGNFDGSNAHQVTTAAKIAVAYADALIKELQK